MVSYPETSIDLFSLYCFVFPIEVPGELHPLSFHKLCVHVHVNKMKFDRNLQFPRVLSHKLYWENKTYKLKRSIDPNLLQKICLTVKGNLTKKIIG